MPGLAALNMPDVPAVSQARRPRPRAAGRQQAVARLAGRARHRREGLAAPAREGAAQGRRPAGDRASGRCKKTAPFPIEQAVVSISPGALSADGASEFVVALSRADVIHQYEQACVMAGVHAGLVDLSTFSVINSILAEHVGARRRLAARARDRHLPDARRDARQRAVVLPQSWRGGRGHARGSDSPDGDVLRGSPARRRLRARADRRRGAAAGRRRERAPRPRANGWASAWRRSIRGRRRLLQDRIGASPELLDVLAPLVGMLLRERKAA